MGFIPLRQVSLDSRGARDMTRHAICRRNADNSRIRDGQGQAEPALGPSWRSPKLPILRVRSLLYPPIAFRESFRHTKPERASHAASRRGGLLRRLWSLRAARRVVAWHSSPAAAVTHSPATRATAEGIRWCTSGLLKEQSRCLIFNQALLARKAATILFSTRSGK